MLNILWMDFSLGVEMSEKFNYGVLTFQKKRTSNIKWYIPIFVINVILRAITKVMAVRIAHVAIVLFIDLE